MPDALESAEPLVGRWEGGLPVAESAVFGVIRGSDLLAGEREKDHTREVTEVACVILFYNPRIKDFPHNCEYESNDLNIMDHRKTVSTVGFLSILHIRLLFHRWVN